MSSVSFRCGVRAGDRLEIIALAGGGLWFVALENGSNCAVSLSDVQLRILRDHLNAHLSPTISPQD